MIRAAALVLPLCLDTFAVAAALGVSRLGAAQRIRLSLLFAVFEGGMPLVGLAFGASIGNAIGNLADYVASAGLLGVGAWMLFADDEKEEQRVRRLAGAGGLAVVGLGLSVSLDELAIGFSMGLARVPVVPAALLIAAQAFLASQVGFALGARISKRLREGAERVAALALIVIGVLLVLAKLVGAAF